MEINPIGAGRGWDRSKDLLIDYLKLFKTGAMYDCSFKVGKQENRTKIFKCHKIILSAASSVFQAMLFGYFSEAKKDRDDPIRLADVDPDVFISAMVFLYGQRLIFKGIKNALGLYAFADKMQIISLMATTKKYFDKVKNCEHIVAICDFSITTGIEIPECINILYKEATRIMSSKYWLKVSPVTVEYILQMDEISIAEIDLFKSLVRWGEAQVAKDGSADDKDQSLLKAKVEPFLKLIRFESMSTDDVGEACCTTKILSSVDHCKITSSIIFEDLRLLPQRLAVDCKRPARISDINFTIGVTYEIMNMRLIPWDVPCRLCFCFRISKGSQLFEFLLGPDFSFDVYTPKYIYLYQKSPLIQIATYEAVGSNKYILEPDSMYSLCPSLEYGLFFSGVNNKELVNTAKSPYGNVLKSQVAKSNSYDDDPVKLMITNASLPVVALNLRVLYWFEM